jgi:hypothetical protein
MQLGGGFFYLLNKIFFSFKERTVGNLSRQWRIWAWVVYIIGLPFWLVILSHEKNWMVTFVEAGGLPSMGLGLFLAFRRKDEEPTEKSKRWEQRLDTFARAAAFLGIAYSVYDFGGFATLNQWVELGVVVGFLVGTYRLANDKLDGYLWFLLMNASAGLLMYIQNYEWLAAQQVVSLLFVLDAYRMKKRTEVLMFQVRPE